jgi:glycosyltransferase involved in cell wall biosynthesis
MVISVIIVNYRVRYFLELCLASVQKALMGFEAEVLVVDNNSGDGGIEALRSLFPSVRFIENGENVGFAKANNQALTEAVGEYVLFLNPDSVLPEDFVRVCLGFMEAGSAEQGVRGSGEARRPVAGGDDRPIGAVGVRMVDGLCPVLSGSSSSGSYLARGGAFGRLFARSAGRTGRSRRFR